MFEGMERVISLALVHVALDQIYESSKGSGRASTRLELQHERVLVRSKVQSALFLLNISNSFKEIDLFLLIHFWNLSKSFKFSLEVSDVL